jgi:DNA-binding NtrC family response regulator
MLLIVDNDVHFLEEAQATLDAGRGMIFASSAKQAKDLIGSIGATFSVIMIDLDLGRDDGFDLILEMRRQYPDLPVIAISGVYRRHILESAKALGAVDALSKPITPEWNLALARARQKQRHD